jgi:Na+/H+-dicarboxylate symporter
MIVLPLVCAVVFTGVARLGNVRALGRLGAVTLAFFWGTTVIAIGLGMSLMQLALPLAPPPTPVAAPAPDVAPAPGIAAFVVSLVPPNPVSAAVRGDLLPLIVFVAAAGAAAATLRTDARRALLEIADSVSAAMIQLVHWILRLAPVGVFALAAAAIARSGWAMLTSLAVFIAAVLAGLVVCYALVYLPAVRWLGGIPVRRFLLACVGPVGLAMSTTSSAASLPALFESAADLGLSRDRAGFVLSLGAAINRAGSALFQGAAIVFLASVYRVTIPPAALGGAFLTTFLLAQTVAGVPSAGVVALAPVLGSLGIPLEGLALLLGVDRIPDMARTATQVTGHLAAATVAERMTKRVMGDA